MREILKLFFRAEGTNPVIVLTCLIVAGLAEGLGFASLIPLLAIATGDVHWPVHPCDDMQKPACPAGDALRRLRQRDRRDKP
jgi:hypothetical protein